MTTKSYIHLGTNLANPPPENHLNVVDMGLSKAAIHL